VGEVCEIEQLNLDFNSPASDIENRNLNGVYYFREHPTCQKYSNALNQQLRVVHKYTASPTCRA
jgi:hypothetical protein